MMGARLKILLVLLFPFISCYLEICSIIIKVIHKVGCKLIRNWIERGGGGVPRGAHVSYLCSSGNRRPEMGTNSSIVWRVAINRQGVPRVASGLCRRPAEMHIKVFRLLVIISQQSLVWR